MTDVEGREDFVIPVRVTAKQVEDVLYSAFEGGVGYWCRIMGYRDPVLGKPIPEPTFPYAQLPLLGGSVICRLTDEGETDENFNPLILDRAALDEGLTLMSQRSPHQFGNILSGDFDATTGDILVQYALLGAIVYG